MVKVNIIEGRDQCQKNSWSWPNLKQLLSMTKLAAENNNRHWTRLKQQQTVTEALKLGLCYYN